MTYIRMYPTYVCLHDPSSQLIFLNPSILKNYLNDLRILLLILMKNSRKPLSGHMKEQAFHFSFSNLARNRKLPTLCTAEGLALDRKLPKENRKA